MHITFVCTGNICRSPMAELLARDRYEGHTFDSSGVYAMVGWEMTGNAQHALEEIGVWDTGHRARDFTGAATAQDPDVIYVMTTDHIRAVTQLRPDLTDRVGLLDPDGREIDDPYGGTMDDYRRARDHIMRALEVRLG